MREALRTRPGCSHIVLLRRRVHCNPTQTQEGPQSATFLISMSIIEIYQEKLADLLTEAPGAAWNRTAAQNAGLALQVKNRWVLAG
jgi:hypothetical protein